MITPAHILISIAGLTRGDDQVADAHQASYLWPATIGAVLPDAPMFVFYGIEKLILGSTDHEIWSNRYFAEGWQSFFDAFNSIPICAVFMWLAWRLGLNGWVVLFASMLVHCVCDLPLHHDDGHRHFWPIFNWRFNSPVSYWDPKHHGVWGATGEAILSAICFWIAFRRHKSMIRRCSIAAVGFVYAILIAGYFAMIARGVDF